MLKISNGGPEGCDAMRWPQTKVPWLDAWLPGNETIVWGQEFSGSGISREGVVVEVWDLKSGNEWRDLLPEGVTRMFLSR